jgi:hypothetical protein
VNKLPAESQEAYQAFLDWALSYPRARASGGFAESYRWEERVKDLPEMDTPEKLMAFTARWEASKLLRKCLSTSVGVTVIAPRDVLALVTATKDVAIASSTRDMSRLTDQESEELHRLLLKSNGIEEEDM